MVVKVFIIEVPKKVKIVVSVVINIEILDEVDFLKIEKDLVFKQIIQVVLVFHVIDPYHEIDVVEEVVVENVIIVLGDDLSIVLLLKIVIFHEKDISIDL